MYIIPANSKKSRLILGFFTPVDLVIFLTGVSITLILLLLIKASSLGGMILILLPALISSFLVLPIAYYHNVRQLIGNFISFWTQRRMFIWKGWCWYNGEEESSQQQ